MSESSVHEVDFSDETQRHMFLIAIFLKASSHFLGFTTEELIKKCGFSDQEVLSALKRMMERGWVTNAISQEGTSGPYAIRFKLVTGITILGSIRSNSEDD